MIQSVMFLRFAMLEVLYARFGKGLRGSKESCSDLWSFHREAILIENDKSADNGWGGGGGDKFKQGKNVL